MSKIVEIMAAHLRSQRGKATASTEDRNAGRGTDASDESRRQGGFEDRSVASMIARMYAEDDD